MPSAVLVGLDHHHRRVPADEGADAALDVLVAGEERLLLGRDGVDVRRGHRGRRADLQLAGPLEQLGRSGTGPGSCRGCRRPRRGESSHSCVSSGSVSGSWCTKPSMIMGSIVSPPLPEMRHHQPLGVTWSVDDDGRLHRRRLLREPRARRLGLGGARRPLRVAAPRPAPPTSAWRSPPPSRRCARSTGRCEIVSDSTYVVNCFRDRWYEGWMRRGWMNSQRKPVANRDLWEPFIELVLARGDVDVRLGEGPRRRPHERPRRPARGGGRPHPGGARRATC